MLLVATLFLATTHSPIYPIATGLGVLLFLRLGVLCYTRRLRLGAEALVITSYFGRQQIPYESIRVIRYGVDEETKRVTVTLTTMERDLDLDWYEESMTIAEEVRRRCPGAKIQDERTLSLPSALR